MTDLSPAAQAVMNAAIDVYWKEAHLGRRSIAAALRAAADQCAEGATHWNLYAIATELEGHGQA